MPDRYLRLPTRLQPNQIVSLITSVEASNDLIFSTEHAYTLLFSSKEFSEYDESYKQETIYNYRLLMDGLRRMAEFEKRFLIEPTDHYKD